MRDAPGNPAGHSANKWNGHVPTSILHIVNNMRVNLPLHASVRFARSSSVAYNFDMFSNINDKCKSCFFMSFTDPQIPFIPSLTPVVPFDDSLECYDECDLEFSQHNCTRSKTAISESQSQIRDCKRRQRERIRLRQRSSTVTSSAASVESYMESAELSVIADDMSDEHELDLSVSNPLRVNDDNSKT